MHNGLLDHPARACDRVVRVGKGLTLFGTTFKNY